MTKILIIDDRVDNLVSAKAIINKYEPDYEVIVSQTGSQGIEMAQSDDPDTVVLDINMPQMDGYEVCSRLRSMEATKHIPIIFLTAVRTSLVDRIKGLEIGGDAYLTKPLNPAELMAQIKVMLRIKRAEDSLRQDKDLLAREVDRKTKTLQQSEAELSESESRFRSISESLLDWVWEVDLDGKYTYSSGVVSQILGYTKEEIIGKTPFDFMEDDEANRVGEIFRKLIAQKKSIRDLENWNIHKDGHKICVSTNGAPIFDKNGHLLGYRGVDRDITERIKTDSLIKASEVKYRSLFEGMVEGFALHKIVLDKNNNPVDYIFLEVNQAFESQTGLRSKDIVGKKATEVLPGVEKDPANWIGIYGKVALSGEKMRFEQYSQNLDRWYSVTAYATGNHQFATVFIDVTDARQSQQTILEQKHFLEKTQKKLEANMAMSQSIINAIPDALVVVDSERNIVSINNSFHKILGYSEAELLGRKTSYFYESEDEFKRLGKLRYNMTAAEQADPYVVNYRRKNGEVFPGETLGVPILNNHGERIGFIGVIRDITERKLAEFQLQASEQRYRSLVESAPVGILSIDNHGKILSVNPKILETLGSPSAEATMEINLFEFKPLIQNGVAATFREVIESGKPVLKQSTYTSKWGKTAHLSYSVVPIYGMSEQVVGAQAIVDDITERKQAEDKIHEKDIQFRKLSSNLPDLIFQFTRKPDGSYCVPIASEGIKNIFGCSPEDVREDFTPIANVIYPEDAERVINDIEYSAKHLTYFTSEFRVQIPGKPIQWIYSRSSPEKLDDGGVTWYGFNADITERKEAEERLAEALLAAKSAINFKDQFIANISHEIRTPLNSILGFSDLLKKRLENQLAEKDHDVFGYIANSSQRLMKTVDSMLNISQLQTGLIKMQPEEVDLTDMVANIYNDFKAVAANKQLGFILRNASQPRIITVDQYSINQAILGIVDNALKYTFEGSVELVFGNRGEQLILSIADTGIGISEDYQERLFEPYTQESEGFTKSFQGIGLGLALAKQYLNLNQIELEMDSKKGVGTTFTMIFPNQQDQ